MTTSPTRLSESEIANALKNLPRWKISAENRLEAEFKFKSFREAFSFMTRVAFEAEELNHHPDWYNSYNRVRIELTTHDAGGVSENDLELARRISGISWT